MPDSKLNYPMEHKNISLAYPHCTFPHYQYLSHNMINLSNYFKFLDNFHGNCDTCVWFGDEIERKKYGIGMARNFESHNFFSMNNGF